jgi:hypothetical protein
VPAAETRPATPFEYLVQVILPNKCVRTGNRKTKVEKAEPLSFGPANMKANIGWDHFTAAIAGLVKCQPPQLCIGTMEWHWLKPANTPWLPLQNETSLISMLNKVVASKSSPYVIIRMQPPKPPAEGLAPSWAGNGAVGTPVDEDEQSDNDDRLMFKKVLHILLWTTSSTHKFIRHALTMV